LRSSRRKEIAERIGLELRALYGEVLSEPLPERFNELLGRLEEKTTAAAVHPPTAGQVAPLPSTARTDRAVPRLRQIA